MNSSARQFVEPRKIKIIQKRVLEILNYIIFCYRQLCNDNQCGKTVYSKQYVKDNTSSHFEDYLKKEFVDNYLQQLKKSYPNSKFIQNVLFQYETVKRFIANGIERDDKIDIIINNIGLQEYWKYEVVENIYFAIECKILNNTLNNSEYLKDIWKFTRRKYIQLRLPFEGMIGFIEYSTIPFKKIIDDLNNKLNAHKEIKTIAFLTNIEICHNFNSSYMSEHLKQFDPSRFKIYHLFFDYSKLITE